VWSITAAKIEIKYFSENYPGLAVKPPAPLSVSLHRIVSVATALQIEWPRITKYKWSHLNIIAEIFCLCIFATTQDTNSGDRFSIF